MGRGHAVRTPKSSKTPRTRQGTFLALDPGLTTGWASWGWRHMPPGYSYGEIGRYSVVNFLDGCKFKEPDFELIVESFSQREGVDDSALVAPKVIGVVEQWAWDNNHDIMFQTPSQAFFYFTERKLEVRGLLDKKQDHAMAALKHLMYFRRDFI